MKTGQHIKRGAQASMLISYSKAVSQ